MASSNSLSRKNFSFSADMAVRTYTEVQPTLSCDFRTVRPPHPAAAQLARSLFKAGRIGVRPSLTQPMRALRNPLRIGCPFQT